MATEPREEREEGRELVRDPGPEPGAELTDGLLGALAAAFPMREKTGVPPIHRHATAKGAKDADCVTKGYTDSTGCQVSSDRNVLEEYPIKFHVASSQ